MTKKTNEIAWNELLEKAVNEPGSLSKAYSNFHNYSFGNCILAYFQAVLGGQKFGPFATYKKWKELGRQVQRGEKAITLCQPVLINKKDSDGEIIRSEDGKPEKRKIFVYRNRWFFLSQTEGDEIEIETGPEWSKDSALDKLEITEVPFEHANGNTQGYANEKNVAINPVAELPHKTLFHELAHVVLGHTADSAQVDGKDIARNIAEVEAESVALILLEVLDLEGSEFSRGYIQHWLGDGKEIPEKNAARIFSAASEILSAGTGKKGRE
jgi:antirestriction protein ArdC